MVCLDTSFLIDLSHKSPDARERLERFLSEDERVVTTAINAAELYEGAWKSARALLRVDELDRMLQEMVVLEMGPAAAREFGRLKTDLLRRGTSVGDWDILIASIALAYGESRIVTRNVKDFERIPGIEVISY